IHTLTPSAARAAMPCSSRAAIKRALACAYSVEAWARRAGVSGLVVSKYARRCNKCETHMAPERIWAPSREAVSGSEPTRPTRKSGPKDLDTDRISAHRGWLAGMIERYGWPDSCQK